MKRSTLVISIILGIVFLSVIAIILVIALQPISGKSKGFSGLIESKEGVIVFIPLSGEISDGGEQSIIPSGGSITPDFVRHELEKADEDASVKAIIFKINSPGGAVGASQEIAELIRQEKKPVVVFASDEVASGAYYISSQAKKIVANPGSLVGSIGVISQIPDLSGLYDKLGIKMQTIKSGKNKDMYERTLTPEEHQKFQAVSDELYGQFINDVARGRKLNKDKVAELATGEVFPATIAKKYGLVDEIGGYQTAVDTAAKLAHLKNPEVKEYEPSLFEEIIGGPMQSLKAFIRLQSIGREFSLLQYAHNAYGSPQYRYYGGQ